eukprot:scaffold7204_cov354-Prasinococcus_capsulatus_cf.AAC.14
MARLPMVAWSPAAIGVLVVCPGAPQAHASPPCACACASWKKTRPTWPRSTTTRNGRRRRRRSSSSSSSRAALTAQQRHWRRDTERAAARVACTPYHVHEQPEEADGEQLVLVADGRRLEHAFHGLEQDGAAQEDQQQRVDERREHLAGWVTQAAREEPTGRASKHPTRASIQPTNPPTNQPCHPPTQQASTQANKRASHQASKQARKQAQRQAGYQRLVAGGRREQASAALVLARHAPPRARSRS